MISVSLATMRAQAAKAAAVEVASDGRHTTSEVNSMVNSAVRKYHQELAKWGLAGETRTTVTTTSSTASSNGWPANSFVALPSDLMTVKSMSIHVDGRWYQMFGFSELERDNYESEFLSERIGRPEQYRVSTGSDGSLIARLIPHCDAAYTIRVIYVPSPTTLSSDGATHAFLDGSEEYVPSDVAMALLEADGVKEGNQYQAIMQRRDRALAIVREFADRVDVGGGPKRIQPTSVMRRLLRKDRYWPPA